MSPVQRILLAIALWITLVLFTRWIILPLLRVGPNRDPRTIIIWRIAQIYCALIHRAQYLGFENLRRKIDPGPLIIVANHTCAVDPVLIQSACHFAIRWLMAREMMIPHLDWLWETQRIIPVDREKSESRPLREAIRHIRAGRVIGIFPEARIVKPPGQIRPFQPGVGAIVAKTRAPVLLVWISGTPDTQSMTRSFLTPSRARIQFVDLMHFHDTTDPAEITRRIRRRLAQASSWPLNDDPMPADPVPTPSQDPF